MKKRPLTILIVLLLVALISWLAFRGRGPGSSVVNQIGSGTPTLDRLGAEGSSQLAQSNGHAARSGGDRQSSEPRERRSRSHTRPAGFESTIGLGNIYFLRSGSIVTSPDPGVEQADVLSEAVANIMETFPRGSIVFDVDGISTSEAPVVLFANEHYDLTSRVAEEFRQIEAQRAIAATIEMVEQGTEVKRVAHRQ